TTLDLTATPSVSEGGSITYTASVNHPTDTALTVTLSNGQSITIAAGAATGSITLPAQTDDVYNDAGNVSVSITGQSGGNFENLVVGTGTAVTAASHTMHT